jgi:hypothetical protein
MDASDKKSRIVLPDAPPDQQAVLEAGGVACPGRLQLTPPRQFAD